MTDLTDVFGNSGFKPSNKQHLTEGDALDQIRKEMQNSGLTPPNRIIMDGNIHRFSTQTNGKTNDRGKTGWYVFYQDAIPCGSFGCWRLDVTAQFRADIGRELTFTEHSAHKKRMEEIKRKVDDEAKVKQEIAEKNIDKIWNDCGPASDEHPYLMKKGVKAHGAKITGDGRLIVPLYDEHGELASLQYIDSEGGKRYHSGAATKGLSWLVGDILQDEPVIYVAEGFATAATIHEVTKKPCFAAYSASNLPLVIGGLRDRFGQQTEIVIVADNDKGGIGQKYADQASAKHGARVIIPPIEGDANDYAQAGHDLAGLLHVEPKEDWLEPAMDFCKQPDPISWLVKGWLQRNALIMIHGPSGGGKTFCVLDMALSMASGRSEWAGHRVTPGKVVYLAGEGHIGLKSRLAGWLCHNQVNKLDMWVSRSGCDLNTKPGYQLAAESIRSLNTPPDLIIVDTLHRFLLGDENSAQDAKTMLDACNQLMADFNCSVVLVHHTGVSNEAQHRARGSSAWKGALDIEISVVPQDKEDNKPLEIIQRKSKDAELTETVYGYLVSTPVYNWLDEDGQQVSTARLEITDDRPSDETKPKKESKLDKFKKLLERAFWKGGAEIRNNRPYVSRSAMKELLRGDEYSEATIKQYLKASHENGFIYTLINRGIVQEFEHGWIVKDNVLASVLLVPENNVR